MTKPTTNNDIYEILGEMRADLKQIKAQVTMTNGRVNALESWQGAVVAVERYKDTIVKDGGKSDGELARFFNSDGIQKIMLALAGAITAFALTKGIGQ